MRFLILQHLAIEHPGVFAEVWRSMDIVMDTVDFDAGQPIPANLGDFDALVVMGGPMDVWEIDRHAWLVPELAAIRRTVIELSMPFLGICLGHQLLASALGGEVRPAAQPEVGLATVSLTDASADDPLLAGLESPLDVFQWHGSEVARLPDGACLTATNDACRVQSLRWGRHAFGLQFHAEVTDTMIDGWAEIPAYRQSLDHTLGAGGADRLRREFRRRAPVLRRSAEVLAHGFARLIPVD